MRAGGGNAPFPNRLRQGDSHLGSGGDAARVVVRARLLHVRGDHDPLVGRDPAGNLRDERAHGRGGEAARNGDADRRRRGAGVDVNARRSRAAARGVALKPKPFLLSS